MLCDRVGPYYFRGEIGLPQDQAKAVKLWLRAGELGHAAAYFNLGTAHDFGEGVKKDETKAKYYYELAALRGDAAARHNLGALEEEEGNISRAMTHWMISAGQGCDISLKVIRELFRQKMILRRRCVLTKKPKMRRRATRGKQL